VKCIIEELERELPPLDEFVLYSFECCVEFFANHPRCDKEPKFMYHLKRAAFGG